MRIYLYLYVLRSCLYRYGTLRLFYIFFPLLSLSFLGALSSIFSFQFVEAEKWSGRVLCLGRHKNLWENL